MQTLCVFCGSSSGKNTEHALLAERLGKTMAREKIALVYGGASVGLMGTVADAAMAEGGHVIGVIPEQLVAREVAHNSLSELIVVQDMHERKARMADLSDGFIALPGGLGTLEELFEVLTWAQLGFHKKPCGLLNSANYYDSLIRFLDDAVNAGFIRPIHRQMLQVGDSVDSLLALFQDYQPPSSSK
ncbi:MAG: TIGR00730 family Rossman fold protein [Pseudohongiellaceae bacterium]